MVAAFFFMFYKVCKKAHTAGMKITTVISSAILILFGIFAAVYALSGFDLLLFLCAGSVAVYRAILSLAGVAALWLFFFFVAFRPLKYLS